MATRWRPSSPVVRASRPVSRGNTTRATSGTAAIAPPTAASRPPTSAYDCGACGGGRGGANARAFALMANDPRVRRRLAEQGLTIPTDTAFIGGMQDTCSDGVDFYDRDRVPAGHRGELAAFETACHQALAADAQERCRRFDSVPLDVTAEEALRRVEGRANDLAQVRPELGHATNAICLIGRRRRSRGLFLDRRAFLVSYDPDGDAAGEILARTLAAVGPVAAGINLAYTLGRIDPIGYGCGTKLPHNITGLIGVMDGHASDLRTGLPWQTVEIHEPVRLLVVIDAPVERILAAIARVPPVQRLVANRWVQVAAWGAAETGLCWFDGERFQPYVPEADRIPTVARSIDWFGGHRGHLPPARTTAALAGGLP
ncbi:MAG: putative inorganic carbon transporter subunit DabA [Planctomycetia bacterium]